MEENARKTAKDRELKLLAQAYRETPEFFRRDTIIEDSKFLEEFGIYIENKDRLPMGYIKLWPQDFIVEEISPDGTVFSVDPREGRPPEPLADYRTVYATAVKCELSTIELAEELSKSLGIDKKQIQFAGIKDKDAITAQQISFRGVPWENVRDISSPYFFLKDLVLGKGVSERGGLRGNKFTIFVRTQGNTDEDIWSSALERVKKDGFYNFYYLQRFGTPRLVNFHWGFLLLRGDYEGTIESFLTLASSRELPYFQSLRANIKNVWGDWKKIKEILDPFPIIFQNELRVIEYLVQNPEDFRGALLRISEQITLWVYAFSSWLFNYKISSFLQKKEAVPEVLPLIMSRDAKDWERYQGMLEKLELFPISFENIKPFPGIQMKKNLIKTRVRPVLHQSKIE
ncbi:MAG: tRNA pseudouridine(13) synthase TruD, partial [Candidatus Ryanbacteria bacterium]|nr:tRNA pseudouridine(13) synthase TruD [Candidatus Ryanbacteria bacterium]